MFKIKYLKNYKDKIAGDIEYVENNQAFNLTNAGLATLTKEDKQMLTNSDKDTKRIKTK